VIVADSNEASARAVAEGIRNEHGRAWCATLDVTNENEVIRVVEETIARYGAIDILVNNAGIQVVQPLEQFSYEQWQQMMAVHVHAAFATTRACLPHMYARGTGSIIYMGSVHSKAASAWKGPYVVAKHALLGIARAVATEGAAHGVRANVICPGFVRTPLVERQIPQLAESLSLSADEVIHDVMLKDTVDGEFTTVDDVAEVALFLAGFSSNALTGQSVVVSHGWVMA
jgi:3-hydroxybutyrate dehydrogenase